MLKLFYAVKPLIINQLFGANPEYYAKFLDASGQPEKGHMGMDFAASHGQALYAPVEGDAFYVQDSHGGDGIYIKTQADDGNWYNVILWHLCSKDDPQYKPLIPTDGSKVHVKIGQLIGYTDNTGAPFESSGDHLHVGLMPIREDGTALYPANGYGGCIDPWPYFGKYFAQDVPTLNQKLAQLRDLLALLIKSLQGKIL